MGNLSPEKQPILEIERLWIQNLKSSNTKIYGSLVPHSSA